MKIISFVCTVLLGAWNAYGYNLYPTYVVTTTGEGTNEIADAEVEVTASEGATPTTKTFSALDKTAGNFKGTFVKRGTGFLRSSSAMQNFTGEIIVENGALMADLPGDLGPADYATAPTVTVCSAGTAYFTASKAKEAHFYNVFKLQGEGYKGLGAVHSAIRSHQNDYMFYNRWYLLDDTRLGMSGPYRFDFRASYKQELILNDHTLTITNFANSTEQYCGFYSAVVDPGAGHIKQCGGTLFVHGVTWMGAETNTLTFTKNARFYYQTSAANIFWSAYFLGNTAWVSDGAVFTSFNKDPVYNKYSGPVIISNGTLSVSGSANPTNGLTLTGPVSGNGSLRVNNMWLSLVGRTNDFCGTVTVAHALDKPKTAAGLGLFDPKALDERTTVALTNAPLAVYDGVSNYRSGAWRLGPTACYVSAGTNYCVLAATNRSFATCDESNPLVMSLASLRKTGAGRLDLCGAVSVTGLLDVAEGTVRLRAPVARCKMYSTQPGLSFRVGETNRLGEALLGADKDWEKDCIHYVNLYRGFRGKSWHFAEDGVAPSVYLAGVSGAPYWHSFQTAEYVGYIWNRTGKTMTWRFAGAVNDAYKFYVDGYNVGGDYDGGNATFNNLSLTNGPHKIEIVLWNKTSPGGARTPTSRHPFWNKTGMGFAICTNETKVAESTTNAVDYIVPMNAKAGLENPGGDGLWFTRDNRWPEDVSDADLETFWASERATFSAVRLAAGATLDLAGGTNTVATLEGAGTVANGKIVVTGRLSHTGSAPLAVTNGTLAFGPDATLAVDDPLLVKRGTVRTLATATAIEGTPNASALFADHPGRVGVSADGQSLVLEIFRAGTTVIVR